MSKRDGGPAFPLPAQQSSGPNKATPGMTLRDYFAGQVLAGECSTYVDQMPELNAETIARRCYALADAMLAQREADNAEGQ